MDIQRKDEILALSAQGKGRPWKYRENPRPQGTHRETRHKDIKLRTFIAEGSSRNDLAAHVYDVTYGCIRTGKTPWW